jgi:HEAT repeat protein
VRAALLAGRLTSADGRRFGICNHSVLEACAETLGAVAAQAANSLKLGSDPRGDALSAAAFVEQTFAKPLVELVGDKNKGVSATAALSLARVLPHAAAVDPVLAKYVPRLIKLVDSPSQEVKGEYMRA